MFIREFRGAAVGTVLMGAGAGYLAGVVGPPVRALESRFDVSLTEIGLLTSVFFAGIVVLSPLTPFVVRALGLRGTVLLAPALMGAGGVVSAVAPTFSVVLVGRGIVEASYRLVVPRSRSEIRDVAAPDNGSKIVLIGFASGFANVIGPYYLAAQLSKC